MSKSGVYEVYNKTAEVISGFRTSAKQAVAKACFLTEDIAKREIERQVYSMPELKYGARTGAAKASIYANVPDRNDYAKAASTAKALSPGIKVFADVRISTDPDHPEGIVTHAVLYGFFIEFGTTRVHVSVPARPFMTPAAEQVGPEFEYICLHELEAEIK